MGGEHAVLRYNIKYLDPISKRWVTTRWKMTEEDAAKRYAGQGYEVIWSSKEVRVVGFDPWENRNSMGHFNTGTPDHKKPK